VASGQHTRQVSCEREAGVCLKGGDWEWGNFDGIQSAFALMQAPARCGWCGMPFARAASASASAVSSVQRAPLLVPACSLSALAATLRSARFLKTRFYVFDVIS
jgi:hypothetical protein